MATIKRLDKGKYSVYVELAPDYITGKRVQKTVIVNGTLAQAQEVERELLKQSPKRQRYTINMTVQYYLNTEWLGDLNDHAEQTIYKYKKHVENFIVPAIGHISLSELTTKDIERMLNAMSSPGNARKVFATLRSALNTAVRVDMLSKNPCDNVVQPKLRHREFRQTDNTYTLDEVARIYPQIKGEWWECLWLVCIFGGLRPEEAFALDVPARRWDGRVVVNQAYTGKGSGGYVMSPCKTRNSYRTVLLPKDIKNRILSATKGRLGPIAIKNGNRAQSDYFSRDYKAWCAKRGIKYVTPKDMRHTAATLLLAAGADVGTLAAILGHSDKNTAMKFYIDPTASATDIATTKLGKSVADILALKSHKTEQNQAI